MVHRFLQELSVFRRDIPQLQTEGKSQFSVIKTSEVIKYRQDALRMIVGSVTKDNVDDTLCDNRQIETECKAGTSTVSLSFN